MQRYTENYFKRFADRKTLIDAPIHPECQTIIVIPCYNEPDLLGTLNSLLACEVSAPTEVIVVVNEAEGKKTEVGSGETEVRSRKTQVRSGETEVRCGETEVESWKTEVRRRETKVGRRESEARSRKTEVRSENELTIAVFLEWKAIQASKMKGAGLCFHLIKAMDLPPKTAGVGLARKIGMDEALRRFDSIKRNGTIVCLDADCRVSPNYLKAIHKQFTETDANLGLINFEHQYALETEKGLQKGIIYYELFLRYYVEGLRESGFPHAIHTIGSCMLVKAATYAKHGGMNKRKAGEDFYFLHKIVPHEQFVTVTQATVYPSCRISHRVPFGTGKAQNDWLHRSEEEYQTYDPIIFSELKCFFAHVDDFYTEDLAIVPNSLSLPSQAFIREHKYWGKIELIRKNCKTVAQFRKQFFIWFDGFICLKFVHFLRDNFYPNVLLTDAAAQLVQCEKTTVTELLFLFRQRDLRC